MDSVRSYYKITLMHLLNIILFAHSVKIQRSYIFVFFLIAIANDREITQKKRPVSNPVDIKMVVFCRKEKEKIVQK